MALSHGDKGVVMANIREGMVRSFSVDPGKTQVVRSNWATRMEVVSAGGTNIVTIVPANAEVTISSSAEGYSDLTINMHVEKELAPHGPVEVPAENQDG
jgi:hypothetical protein